jgi:hypothetical protein
MDLNNVVVDDDDGGGGDHTRNNSFDSVPCSICLEIVSDHALRSFAKLQCGHQFHLGNYSMLHFPLLLSYFIFIFQHF